MEHWQGSVYRQVEDDIPDNWETIKAQVAQRDRFKCQMCDIKTHLSIHHIMPRCEGGSSDPSNLITLCYDCHDLVEYEGVKEEGLIRNWFDGPIFDDRPISDVWQSWVYGGCRRPR